MKTEKPGKAATTLKRMGAIPGDCEEGTFTLLNHIAENLSVEEQIQRISDFFIAVSQEFPPLSLDQLTHQTIQKLNEIQPSEIPIIEEYEIFQILYHRAYFKEHNRFYYSYKIQKLVIDIFFSFQIFFLL